MWMPRLMREIETPRSPDEPKRSFVHFFPRWAEGNTMTDREKSERHP